MEVGDECKGELHVAERLSVKRRNEDKWRGRGKTGMERQTKLKKMGTRKQMEEERIRI